jgi:putative ABC transport system permease protein
LNPWFWTFETRTKVINGNDFIKVSVFELNEQSKQGFIFKQSVDKQLWNRFERGNNVIVSEPYAYHHNASIGQTITLQTDQGKVPFEIIGIYADYSGDQGHLAMSRQTYLHHWPDLGYSGLGVYANGGVDLKRLESEITRLLSGNRTVKSTHAIYQASMQVFEQTFTVTEALRWLSALMGLTAGLFAIPIGFSVAYVLIFVIYQRSFGWTMAFHVNAGVIFQGLALAVIAATLAGILPALKMARTQPAEALRSE